VVAILACVAQASDPPTKPRNVLFVICDDLCCALGTYGDATAISPNIDKLAKRGVQFERAYCQFPLCNPSRSSFLTGRRPTTTKVNDNARHFRKTDPDTITLPQAFRKAGWNVERIGKLYHYSVPNGIGTSGHDDPPSWDAVFNPKGRDVTYKDKIFSLKPGQFGGTVSWLAADGTDAEQTDGIGAAHAVARLEAFAKDPAHTPFFLAVGFYRPHTPYVAPKPWFEKHPLDTVQLPEVPADHDAKIPPAAIGSRKKEQDRLVGDLGREALQAYRASVSFVDAQVGVVVDALDRLGLADDTVIVFTSDHGYHLGEHGLWQKQSLFEESARVPLVIAVPEGRSKGVRAPHTVELLDLAPTLCDLSGVPKPAGFEGRSLAPLFFGDDTRFEKFPERPAFTEVDRGGVRGVSVRSGRWRYTLWNGGKAGRELYDHDADPRELDNLASRPEHDETMRQLEALIRDLFGDDLGP
jgi:uncharacterized sulfatase